MSIKNVLIVDDHALFLEGLSVFFEQHYQGVQVHIANSAVKALGLLSDNLNIDLILLDLAMPEIDGQQFLNEINKKHYLIPLIIVSGSENSNQIQNALTKGAMGFIPKAYSGEQMKAAIQQVLDGNIYLPEEIRYLVEGDNENGIFLSDRQVEVLKLICNGLSNKQIGYQLKISEATVKTHISKIFDQFNVHSRMDCAKKANELGYFSS